MDVSDCDYINIDYYIIESIELKFFIKYYNNGGNHEIIINEEKKWITVQIPLSYYPNKGINLIEITDFLTKRNGNILLNNIYFTNTELVK